MAQVKAPDIPQPEQKQPDYMTEERLHEILSILFPWGYSHKETKYTGVSPYIGDRTNIITIVANDPAWGSMPLSIIMEAFDEESNEDDSLGFYKGIMKLIAPELHSDNDNFKGIMNMLDFNWAEDRMQDNRFPVKVEYHPE